MQLAVLCMLGTPLAGIIGLGVNMVAAGRRKLACLWLLFALPVGVLVLGFALTVPQLGFFVALALAVGVLALAHAIDASYASTEHQSWVLALFLGVATTMAVTCLVMRVE